MRRRGRRTGPQRTEPAATWRTTPPSSAPSAATTYAYDQAARLTAVSGSATASYRYDANGLRANKTVGAVTTNFTWDDEDVPDLLSDGTTRYLYGPGGTPVEQIGGTTQWYFHDQLGSTRALADSTGTITGSYAYTPYGEVSSHTGTAATPLEYAGRYTDAETGLQYLRARYYDPATAEFITVGPAARSTLSAYRYTAGNPLNQVDPTGQFWGFVAAAVGEVAAAVSLQKVKYNQKVSEQTRNAQKRKSK